MSSGQGNEPSQQPKLRLREFVKQSTDEAWEVMDHTKGGVGAERLQFAGALILGVCIVFFASMLSTPHLDTALQVAVAAFAVGIPLLFIDAMMASMKFGPGLRKYLEWYTTGMQVTGWVIGDGVGGGAVFVGVLAIIWHLSEGAFWAAIITLGIGLLALVVGGMGNTARQGWHLYQEEQAQKDQEHKGGPVT